MTVLQLHRQRVAGYIRVSRVGGRKGDGYISPEDQKSGILERATQLDVTIPEDAWLFDEDRTGGNFRRPEWQRLMERVESGELAGVICVRVDRFVRNVAEGASMIARSHREGGGDVRRDRSLDGHEDRHRSVHPQPVLD